MTRFPETRWSLVLRARSPHGEVSRAALNDLFEIYTGPVDRYLVAARVPRQQVADVRQAFFLDLLAHGAIDRVDRAKTHGFRYFLMGALKKHLGRTGDWNRAIKRGGGRADLSLDDVFNENGHRRYPEPLAESDPEREFMIGWIVTLVERALACLSEEFQEGGRDGELDAYREFLTSDEEPDHAHLAQTLGTTPGASRARLVRLRRRFHALVRQMVEETVGDPRDVDDELRCLLS